jgi:hypothetical protein
MKRLTLILFCLFGFILVSAQNNYEFGILPSLNINKKLPRDYSLNLKAESRQILYNDDFEYKYDLTELSLIGSKKIGIDTKIAIGYLIGINEDGISNRTIQQISLVNRYQGINIGHRFGADQTLLTNQETEFRFRYRISAELPLNGQSLDPNELFLKFNHEYLNSFQAEYDLEIRTSAAIGYMFSPQSKFEIGINHRIDSFVAYNSRNRFWLILNFYQSL